MKDIIEMVNNARYNIGEYCINTCKSKCCRTGFLTINQSQINLLIGDCEKTYLKKKYLLKKDVDKYELNLGLKQCLQLNTDFKCSVHKEENRPRLCKDYPLFIVGKYIIKASNCLAIENDILKEEFLELENLGYKII